MRTAISTWAWLANQPLDPVQLFQLSAELATLAGREVDLVDLMGCSTVMRTITAPAIRESAAGQVTQHDADAFAALVINELHQLHEGNIARYGLRLSEFRRWRDTNPPVEPARLLHP